MDVTKETFQSFLPWLLSAIADSHFVSLDLEFSGIYSKSHGPSNFGQMGEQTLQQRYEETKEAAERYQVLQIGLTCVWEDLENGGYVLRPYNLFLNPVMEERLEVERIWSYQGGAVEFLLKNGFRMEAPYLEGVPYLGRDEEALALQQTLNRHDKSRSIADINVKDEDLESLEFMENVRSQVKAWLAQGSKREEFLNIPPPFPSFEMMESTDMETSLSNFEKRLVHQVVRAEFPDLVTISRRGFIQVVEFNQAREDANKKFQLKRLQERMGRQIGFRWLVEAMCGGDLSTLEPRTFNRVFNKDQDLKFKEIRDRLRMKRTVLVGHNLFTDLVNFYRCFFGALPAKVEDFQKRIHDLFPVVIDTKYLATHNCGSINPTSSLSEIQRELTELETPKIALHPDHPKYEDGGQLHEAGYDSYLTAQVVIRLSTLLHRSGAYIGEVDHVQTSDEDYYTPAEDGEGLIAKAKKAKTKGLKPKTNLQGIPMDAPRTDQSSLDGVAEDVSLILFDDLATKQVKTVGKKIKPALAHATRFDVLADLSPEPSPLEKKRSSHRRRSESSGRSLLDDHPIPTLNKQDNFMPSFGNAFWRVYGNKLRVFGTREGFCDLNPG